MTRIVLISLLWLLVVVPSAFAQSGGWTGNANIFLGGKFLQKDDWDPLEQQLAGGLLLDARPGNWPVSIALDAFYSFDNGNVFGIDVNGSTTDIHVGIRKIWQDHPEIRPYIDGGLAIVNAELEASAGGISVSDRDMAFGVWIGLGAYWTLAQHFNLGFDFRFSKARVTLFGVDGDGGGVHVGLITGYHW